MTTALVLVATFMLSSVLAARADAAESANLDQCANGALTDPVQPTYCNAPDLGVSQWVNGNVNESKAHYLEGDSLPYRMLFDGLTIGSTNTVTIEWDTLKDTKHALDYLTTFNRTVTTANPCAGVAGCNPLSFSQYPIPLQPDVAAGGVTQIGGQFFTMYGGTITSVSAYSYGGGVDNPASITITFTANVANPVLAWAAHIATRADWGADQSAVSIPGSPYHTRLKDLNGSGGNQDRSLSAGAVIYPGTVTVIKDAQPNAADDFQFTTGGGLTPTPFTLDDDPLSGTPNSITLDPVIDFAAVKTVTEGSALGWTLASIVCNVALSNGGSQQVNLGTRTASITIKEAEDWTCTFTNTRNQPSISTTASTTGNVGSAISDTATLSGLVNPSGTRYIVFRAYGPNDPTCSGTPAFTSAQIPVTDNGQYGSGNFTPTLAGTYRWIASYSGDANNAPVSGACNDANETTTVGPDSPSIATSATASVGIGTAITDTATLSGGTNPTGTITFRLYGPNDATCATAGTLVSTETVNGNGNYTSDPITPTQAGTYRWRAFYSGDANNNPVSGACNDAGETSVITRDNPAIATLATNASAGGTITDTATLSGGTTPTGTIEFRVYGPDNATCSGNGVLVSTETVNGNGNYTSDPYPVAVTGDYRWIASYSGDVNNLPVSGACNDAGETSNVGKDSPTIATVATTSVTIGGTIKDTATLSGGTNPTGNIVFRVYGPNDATCSTAGTLVSTETVNGNGSYTSDDFTPTQAGTYRWRAFYSGDSNNNAVSGPCNAANETSVVNLRNPGISTTAVGGSVGFAISDSATLSGAYNATGSITFNLYGPSDPTCTGQPVFTSTVPVNGNGTYQSGDYTPATAGAYHWVASYSGDVNNNPVSGACGDAGETSTVLAPELSEDKAALQVVVDAGDAISFSMTTTNIGEGVAKDVTLSDPLPDGVTWSIVSQTNAGECDITGAGNDQVLECSYGNLAAGASRVVTVTATTSYDQCGQYNNTATASADNAPDDSDDASIVCNKPSVSIDKTTSTGTINAGDVAKFAVKVTNGGPGTAKNVTIEDLLPAGPTWSLDGAAPTGCSIADVTVDGKTRQKVTCTLASFATGSFTFNVKATTTQENCAVYNNTATGTGSNTGPIAPDSATVTCRKLPAISIDKTGPATATAGDRITYSLAVKNTGPTSYSEGMVIVTDALCEAPPALVSKNGDTSPGSLDPDETWTYQCIVQTAVGQTVVNNIGVVNGTDFNGNKASAQDGADTALAQPAVAVLPEVVAAPGAAKLRGPSGCLLKPTAKVYVTGSQILSVRFMLDGKKIGTSTKADKLGRFAATIVRKNAKPGTHRVQAIVTFKSVSKTKPRTLQLRFSRCGEVKPARAKGFTG